MRPHTFEADKAAATAAVRALVTAPPDADVTRLRRAAAETLVEARRHFITSEGLPDWAGRSHAYQRFVSEVFAEAGVPREDAPAVMSSIRYHAGNLIRKIVPIEELLASGFTLTDSPKARAAARKARASETVVLLEGAGPISDPEDAARALGMVSVLLARLQPSALRAMPAAQRREARESLRTAAATAERLAGGK